MEREVSLRNSKRDPQDRTRLTEVGRERFRRPIVRDVSKELGTTAQTQEINLAKSGNVVSKITVTRTVHRNDCDAADQEKCLRARLEQSTIKTTTGMNKSSTITTNMCEVH